MKKTFNWKFELLNYLLVIAVSIIVALGLHVFVYKADFAPSGIDGISTMLQYASESIFGVWINAGIFNFIINLPLLIAAWFVLRRKYVVYTITYTVVVSAALVLFDMLNVQQYDCTIPGTYNSHVVAAIFGGIMQGITGVLLRVGGSGGGVDIIACMVQKKFPHKNVERIIAYLSYAVVAIAFFVYGNINSVCLSVIEIFICEKVAAFILKSNRSAVKFEIVSDSANVEEIKLSIINKLHRGATIVKGQGAYSNEGKEVIICLVNYRQIPELLKLLKDVPNTFIYYSDVTGIRGNFSFESKSKIIKEDNLDIQ